LNADDITDQGGSVLLEYKDVDLCWACYNLVVPINQIKAENKCCMKFALNGRETEICSDRPTDVCEAPMKEILNKIFLGCKAANPKSSTPEPLTCGTDEDYKEQAAIVDETRNENNPEGTAPEVANALAELGIQLPTAEELAAKATDLIADMAAIMAQLQALVAQNSEMTDLGLFIQNADGSTTLQRNDGATIITLPDGTIITIQTDGATTIAAATAFAMIDTNGVMSVADTASNAMATLNADGSIAM